VLTALILLVLTAYAEIDIVIVQLDAPVSLLAKLCVDHDILKVDQWLRILPRQSLLLRDKQQAQKLPDCPNYHYEWLDAYISILERAMLN